MVTPTITTQGATLKPYEKMTVPELLEALQKFKKTPEEEPEEKLIKKLLKALGITV